MTERQIEWASLHDWFVSSHAGRVFCRCWTVDRNGRGEWEYASFTNMAKLRAWAGY